MKGKDLLIVGAIGVGVFLLIPKGKEENGTGSRIITLPSTGSAFDIGGLMGGLTGLLSGIKTPTILTLPSIGNDGIGIGDFFGLSGFLSNMKTPGTSQTFISGFDKGWLDNLLDKLLKGREITEGIDDVTKTVEDVIDKIIPDIESIGSPFDLDIFDIRETFGDWKFAEWTKQGLGGINVLGKGVSWVLGDWQEGWLGTILAPFEKMRDQAMQSDIAVPTERALNILRESKESRYALEKMEEIFTPEQLEYGQIELEKWVAE